MSKLNTSWSTEDLAKLTAFFSEERTNEEKKEFAKELDRTWDGIYRKHWMISKGTASRKKVVKTAKIAQSSQKEIKVTHLQKHPTHIRIGDVVIETYSSRIKVNDVLIDVSVF